MLKLIHVIHGLNSGGAETLVKDYALKINRDKFEFKIICFERLNSPYEKIIIDSKIKIIYISDLIKIKKSNLIFKLLYKIMFYYKLRKVIRDENPDILHTHLAINNYIKFAIPKKNIKIFHTIHTEPKILWAKNDFRKVIDFRAAKWLVKKYNMRFIVLHNEMKKEIDNLFNIDNSIVLNNGIDFNRFSNFKEKDIVRKKLKIPKNCFVIGHIGRFTPSKNHLLLIDIFNELSKIKNNVFLLMIGNGSEIKSVEKKIKELKLEKKCLILSDRMDIPDLLNSMDCFVFPSKYEGLGIVLIEAQKMNLPCFISNTIPEHAIISNLVSKISLNDKPLIWANSILNYKKPSEVYINDEAWDMNKVIKKLEDIYINQI